MKGDWRHTAVIGIAESGAPEPDAATPWLFLNALVLPCPAGWREGLICEQGFRPDHDGLAQAGYRVSPRVEPTGPGTPLPAGGLVLAGRSRSANEGLLARASAMVRPGAPVIACGPKNTGIQALRKWVAGQTEIRFSLSKHHAVAFAFAAGSLDAADGGMERERAGMFSARQPDTGSQLLARHFDKRIAGKVADFGAGWGYLSAELIRRSPGITSLDLYEADHAALEAARELLAACAGGAMPMPELAFHWADLAGGFARRPFDWVVMNPPFHHGLHAGRERRTDLGIAFIASAASTLREGGRLLLVANRGLPYEAEIAKRFRRASTLAEEAGYKVIEAVR